MKKLLIGLILLPFVFSGLKSNPPQQTDKKSIAIEIAKSRVKIAEIDLEGTTQEYEYVKKKWNIANNLKSSESISRDDHIETSRMYIKSLAEMKRAKIRLEEAKLLLQYTEKVGDFDLTPTLR